MSDTKTIHESIIRDIIDLANIADGDDMTMNPFSNKVYKSVAAATDKLTLIFPVFCSNNISIENSVMVSKAIERKCVTMMQMLFSAMQISDAKNAIDYISKFHGNLDASLDDVASLTVDDYVDMINKYASTQEHAVFNDAKAWQQLSESVKNFNYTLPEDINENSLNNYRVDHMGNSINISVIREDTTSDLQKEIKNQQKLAKRIAKANKKFSKLTNNLRTAYRYDRLDYRQMKSMNDMERERVFTTDIKKANELVPTMMVVNFYNAQTGLYTSAVIGIKAKLYPLDSMDIVNRLMLKNKDNQGFHNFIRATTREISFWKDFVFAVDKAKIDALGVRRGSTSKIWKVLERRALFGKYKRMIGAGNESAAISSLVVSKEDVETLKKEYNINIEKAAVIRPIMESYSLMCCVIIDEGIESAKFIFDTGHDEYETLSFSHLERDAQDNSYKKIVNLMTKMSR